MEQDGRINPKVEMLILIVSSFVLSQLSVGMFFFTVPLLVSAPRFKDKKVPVLLILLSGLFAVAMNLVDYREIILDSKYYGIIGFTLYYPLLLTVFSAMWVGLRDFSDVVLRKCVICSIPVVVIGLGFALWLSSGAGNSAYNLFLQSIASIVPEQLASQLDPQIFAETFLTILVYSMVPFGIVFSAVPVLVSEFITHKTDEQWQEGFSYMLMPGAFAWIWMALLVAGLVGMTDFVQYPLWLTITVWNLVLALTLHYLMAGISIVCFRIRAKTPELKASKICSTCIICCFMPGANIVFVAGLSILGILETWIKLR